MVFSSDTSEATQFAVAATNQNKLTGLRPIFAVCCGYHRWMCTSYDCLGF